VRDGPSGVVGTNEIADLVGPFWSGAKVSDELGVSAGVLDARRESGEVLGLVTVDGVIVYPVSQFQRREGRVEVKPAMVPVLRAWRQFDGWTVAVLLSTPAPELDDLTPLAWLDQGREPAALRSLTDAVALEWNAGSGPFR
jgi:hypothetical protein